MNIISLICSFLIAVAVTPIVIFVYKKFGWIDDPKKYHHPKVVHKTPVPRGGGIVIFFAVLIATLLFLPLTKHLVGILLGALLLTVLGFFDDIKNLHPFILLVCSLFICITTLFKAISTLLYSNYTPNIFSCWTWFF